MADPRPLFGKPCNHVIRAGDFASVQRLRIRIGKPDVGELPLATSSGPGVKVPRFRRLLAWNCLLRSQGKFKRLLQAYTLDTHTPSDAESV